MPNIWTPSKDEIKLIKQCASNETGLAVTRLILEPGRRFNIDDDDIESDINIALVARETDWNDTDLECCVDFSEFKKGVKLSESGMAILDFYVSNKDGLHGNVTVYYSNGIIKKIEGYRSTGRVIYTAP